MSISMGKKFKLIRENTGLTQSAFSEMVGISISSLKKYETGVHEVGMPAVMAIANHPDLKKFALWLITDESNPDARQYSPQDFIPGKSQASTKEDYEKAFINEGISIMQMFGYLDWIEIKTDKVEFEALGKLLYKDLQKIIDAHYTPDKQEKVG